MSSSKLAARSSSLLLRHTRLQKTYQKRPSSDSRISPLQRLLFADPDSLYDAQHPIDLLDDHVEYDGDDDDDFVDDDDDDDGVDGDDDDGNDDDAVDEDYDAIDDAVDDGDDGGGVVQGGGKPMSSPSALMAHFQDAVPLDQDDIALPLEGINGTDNTNIIVNNPAPLSPSPPPPVPPVIPAAAIITAVGYHTAGSENNNNINVNGQQQTPAVSPLIFKAKSSKDKDVAPQSLSSVNTKLSTSKPGLTKKGRSKSQHHHHSYQTYVSSIAKSRPLCNDDLADMFSQLYLEQLPHPTRIRNLTDIGTGSTQQKNLAFLLRNNK